MSTLKLLKILITIFLFIVIVTIFIGGVYLLIHSRLDNMAKKKINDIMNHISENPTKYVIPNTPTPTPTPITPLNTIYFKF